MTDTELDKWAAEVVMEWSEIIPQIHAPMVYYGKFSDDVPTCSCTVVKDQWHPTRDLNQAFMVVEKMRERGWKLMFDYTDKAYATFYREVPPEMGNNKAAAEDPNPCVAFLKAAYAALEGEP